MSRASGLVMAIPFNPRPAQVASEMLIDALDQYKNEVSQGGRPGPEWPIFLQDTERIRESARALLDIMQALLGSIEEMVHHGIQKRLLDALKADVRRAHQSYTDMKDLSYRGRVIQMVQRSGFESVVKYMDQWHKQLTKIRKHIADRQLREPSNHGSSQRDLVRWSPPAHHDEFLDPLYMTAQRIELQVRDIYFKSEMVWRSCHPNGFNAHSDRERQSTGRVQQRWLSNA